MSLESFLGYEGGEGMSEAALEALRERMQAAAAQIAAIKKEEGKQKKTEEELLKILFKFVKTSQKQELVLLVARALEQNLPANFILAIILLGNQDIQQDVGKFLMLNAPSGQEANEQSNESNTSLVFFTGQDQSMPLKVRIELDNWIKNIMFQAEEKPQKLIKTAYKIEVNPLPKENDWDETRYEEKKIIQPIVIQLSTYVLRDFLSQNGLDEPYDKLYDFAEFIITGILKKTEESLDGRKMLE